MASKQEKISTVGGLIKDSIPLSVFVRCQNILTAEATILLQFLEKLKGRCDNEDPTAIKIWGSFVDGIALGFEESVLLNANIVGFEEYDTDVDDILALQQLLEQARERKDMVNRQLKFVKLLAGLDNQVPLPKPDSPPIYVADADAATREAFKIAYAAAVEKYYAKSSDKTPDQKEGSSINNSILLFDLINMLKMAASATEAAMSELTERDEDFRRENKSFNTHLKLTAHMLVAIYNNHNIGEIIDIVEKFSSDEVLRMSQSRHSASESPIDNPDFDDDDEDYEDDNENDGGSSLKVEVNDEISRPSSFSSGEYSPESPELSDLENERSSKNLDTDGYIVRQSWARVRKAGQPHCLRMPQEPNYCLHDEDEPSVPHVRDLKQSGFVCSCGTEFPFKNTMERHIARCTKQQRREVPMLQCDLCQFQAQQKCCIETHKRERHGNNVKPKMLRACRRLYQCGYGCEKILKSKKLLFDHQKRTGRQCNHLNAAAIQRKSLPSSAIGFAVALKLTYMRCTTQPKDHHMGDIFNAINRDMERMNMTREEKNKMLSIQDEFVHDLDGTRMYDTSN